MNPNKKTKPWERKSNSSGYKIGKYSQNKRILIVCEGQSEEIYFKSFDVVSLDVKCIDSKGLSKIQLVDFCDKTVNDYKEKTVIFDEVWCVFDMDVKRGEKEFADYDNAIKSAKSKKFNVAYSNDAFELWFYLHYQYTDQQHLRTFYYEQLSNLWNINYERSGKTVDHCKAIYGKLMVDKQANQQNAIKHAEKLHNNLIDLPYSQQNPVTTVYLLVKQLNEFLRGSKHS